MALLPVGLSFSDVWGAEDEMVISCSNSRVYSDECTEEK